MCIVYFIYNIKNCLFESYRTYFYIVGSIFIIFLIVGFSNRLFLETIIWYDEQLVKDGQKSIIEQFKGKENYKNRKKILKIITDTYNK
jgi:hypothetical protein